MSESPWLLLMKWTSWYSFIVGRAPVFAILTLNFKGTGTGDEIINIFNIKKLKKLPWSKPLHSGVLKQKSTQGFDVCNSIALILTSFTYYKWIIYLINYIEVLKYRMNNKFMGIIMSFIWQWDWCPCIKFIVNEISETFIKDNYYSCGFCSPLTR